MAEEISSKKLIEGKVIKIGGDEYTMPPLNFKTLKKVLPLIRSWGSEDILAKTKAGDPDANIEMISRFNEVILLALQRNYPEMTMDILEEKITFQEIMPIVDVIAEISGLVKLGEKKPVRESQAKESTGDISTGISSPLPDTLIEK